MRVTRTEPQGPPPITIELSGDEVAVIFPWLDDIWASTTSGSSLAPPDVVRELRNSVFRVWHG